MSVHPISPRVLARATTVSAVTEMSCWQESDLFAAAKQIPAQLIGEDIAGKITDNVIESLRLADGSPHFVVQKGRKKTGVYVLCISSVASFGALSPRQYDWATTHADIDICVLPCVVQHLRVDAARCVAEQICTLRADGKWSADALAAQFLPEPHCSSSFFGGASALKARNLTREVANGGMQIYPYIAGVATHKHMPQGSSLRCSGDGAFPLMMVQTAGSKNGALRVLWSGLYSAENPVNELEIYALHRDSIELLDARGRVYHAACAELSLFPARLKVGMHLRWSVNIYADSYTVADAFIPEFIGENKHVTHFCTKVQQVTPVQCFGARGYCLQVAASAKLPELHFNVYVTATLLQGRIPHVGETIVVSGAIQAAPDSLVDTSACWADSPQSAAAAQEDSRDILADKEKLPIWPYSAPLAELAAAFIRAGYSWDEPFAPLYRFGRPEFRLLSPQGTRLFVMVDTVVNGRADQLGYRCRFYPDKYPSHMNRTPQGDGPADICFVTLHLDSEDGVEYALKAEFFGTPVSLSLPQSVRMAPARPLDEQRAVELFADCMSTQDFTRILPYLREDLHYLSKTAGLEYASKADTLRHLRSCFDNWQKHKVLSELSFAAQQIEHNGATRVCCLAAQQGEGVSATLLTVKDGMISEILAVALPSLNTESSIS